MLEEGAQIVADPKQPIPMKMIGHVTSSYWSENCGRGDRAGAGRRRPRRVWGETLYVPMPDRTIEVEVCAHGVLRREGRAPQWLRPHLQGSRCRSRACRRSPAKNSRPTGVTLAVLPPAERISLRAPAASVAALSKALGVDLPQKPKTSSVEGRPHARLWLGPDEWLVIDEAGKDPLADCAEVKALHSAVGISHRNVGIAVTGPAAAAAINAAARGICLRLRRFLPGSARAPSRRSRDHAARNNRRRSVPDSLVLTLVFGYVSSTS